VPNTSRWKHCFPTQTERCTAPKIKVATKSICLWMDACWPGHKRRVSDLFLLKNWEFEDSTLKKAEVQAGSLDVLPLRILSDSQADLDSSSASVTTRFLPFFFAR
jgi:hypothetical protein